VVSAVLTRERDVDEVLRPSTRRTPAARVITDADAYRVVTKSQPEGLSVCFGWRRLHGQHRRAGARVRSPPWRGGLEGGGLGRGARDFLRSVTKELPLVTFLLPCRPWAPKFKASDTGVVVAK
jgi:hypothetical protein